MRAWSLKKQTLIAAVQGEIQTARQQRDGKLYQIGVAVYEAHIKGASVDDKLADYFSDIASLEKLLEDKDTKIKEIASRYDEEIGMLKTQLGFSPQPAHTLGIPFPQKQNGASAICEKCGAYYTPGEDMFCTGCGNKFQS